MPSPLYAPSTPQAADGQLASLDVGKGFDFVDFTYPVDLAANPGLNHFVVFFVNESDATQFNFTPKAVQNNASNPIAQIVGTNTDLSNPDSQVDQNVGPGSQSIKHNTKRAKLAICMYMPPSIVTQYSMDWGAKDTGLTGNVISGFQKVNAAGGYLTADAINAMKGIGASVLQSVASNFVDFANTFTDLAAPASRGLGVAINPHAEVLFNGVSFRSFQFDFKFTPRTDEESVVVWNIIQAFKFYSAPEFLKGIGPFWAYPSEFDIQFFSNGRPNDFLNRISTCALVNIQINYCADGVFSSFHPGQLNGVTVDTILSLNFVELELMTKNRIIEGY